MNEQSIFIEALERDQAQRQSYLDQACARAPELRQRVERLLAAHDAAVGFMDQPAGALAPTLDQPSTEQPGTEIGPYKLLQVIGEGGMGVVYMAEQKEPVKRRVALKIIKPGMDTRQVIARFEAERQALAIMDHPNIAKVLEAGTTGSGRPYFVMELVNGIPVTRFCDEQNYTPRECLELFIPICEAVQHAHQKGIIHRDLKPSNILVALYDGRPVPKVIDFGVAKATGQNLTEMTLFTHLGQIVGTLEYMSPEQAQRNQLDIDTRSDIYSLGVVLYELLVGETPFDRKRLTSAALDELLRMIKNDEPAKPSTRLSQTKSAERAGRSDKALRYSAFNAPRWFELDWIVMKALEKDRTRRYETATSLADDIKRYLQNEVVLAGPPAVTYRLQKFLRKYRGAVVSAASVLVLLIVGLATSLFLYLRAERLRDQAEDSQRRVESESIKLAASLDELTIERKLKDQALDAQQAALRRSEALRLTAQSSAVLSESPGLALQLAVESAERMPHLAPANNALLAALAACHEQRTLPHDDAVISAVFSPGGTQVLAVEKTRVVIWNALDGQRVVKLDPAYRLQNIAARFSPDGRQVALNSHGGCSERGADGIIRGYTDRVVRIFDVGTARETLVLRGHTDRVVDVKYSPDGRQILTAAWDGTVRLWNAVNGEMSQTFDFGNALHAAIFSPDGKRVLALSEGVGLSSQLVWDDFPPDARPQVVDPPLDLHVVGASLSVGANSRTWATAGREMPLDLHVVGASLSVGAGSNSKQIDYSKPLARIWDVESGDEVAAIRHRGWGDVSRIAYTADGTQVLIAMSGRVALWNAETGNPVAECNVVEISEQTIPDRWLAASGNLLASQRNLVEACSDRKQALEMVTNEILSPNRTQAASIVGKSVALWNTATGKHLATLLGHEGPMPVQSIEFSPDGTRVVTAGDRTSRLWSVSPIPPYVELLGHTQAILDAQFSPSSRLVVTASKDKSARVWNCETGRQTGFLMGHAEIATAPLRQNVVGEVRRARFSSDGNRIVTVSDDPRAMLQQTERSPKREIPFTPVRVWDSQFASELVSIPGNVRSFGSQEYRTGYSDAIYTQDGRYLVSADGNEDRYGTFDADGSMRDGGSRSGVLFGTDGEMGPYFAIRVWDAATGELHRTLESAVAGTKCLVSHDGLRGFVPSETGFIVYETIMGREVCRGKTAGRTQIETALFSSDHRWLLTLGDGAPRLWNAETGDLIREFGHIEGGKHSDPSKDRAATTADGHLLHPTIAAFNGDSTRFVTASKDGSAHVWDLHSGRHVADFLGHSEAIVCVEFNPDGGWIITGSSDGSARIWNSSNGEELVTYRHMSAVRCASFSLDGCKAITADDEGTARIWPIDLLEVARRRKPRELTPAERIRFELDL